MDVTKSHDDIEPRDGGPAFPRAPHSGEASDDGMSLRDYFAAKWLTTIQAPTPTSIEQIAKDCYRMADAMLKARSQS
jgi:hypothetical protein